MLRQSYRQEATYWGAPEHTGYGGITYAAPELMRVRWEAMPERFTNDRGEELVAQAVVYVTKDVEVGGYLALGNHQTVENPEDIHEAFAIRQFMKVPDLRNVDHERRAFL